MTSDEDMKPCPAQQNLDLALANIRPIIQSVLAALSQAPNDQVPRAGWRTFSGLA